MSPSHSSNGQQRPIIGCTSYRKPAGPNLSIEMLGVVSAYVEAIVAAGGIPLLIPIGLNEADLPAVLDRVDGLLLPGGGDVDPDFYNDDERYNKLRGVDLARDRIELFMARAAVAQRKPVLAICRGHQVFNVALGGTLWQDLESQMPGSVSHDNARRHPRNHISHIVEVRRETKLACVLGGDKASINSLHHQGIRELAPELLVSATTSDGLIEGIEVPGHPFAVGVQWHPENLIHDDPAMLSLFKGLIEAASDS